MVAAPRIRDGHTNIIMQRDATELDITRTPCTVRLISVHNTDRMVVDAARVSYGSDAQAGDPITEKDERLVKYLARNGHMSPFRHLSLTVEIEAPEFTMRQLYKHVVGIEATSTHPTKDHAWNEVSGRYRKLGLLYHPPVWNRQHENSKQCSGGPLSDEKQVEASVCFTDCLNNIWESYDRLITLGVSKEQARLLLPMCFVTKVMWTASLEAIEHFVELRQHEHSQWEIRQLADEIEKHAVTAFPVSYAAVRSRRHGPT